MLVNEVIDVNKVRSSKRYKEETIGGTAINAPTMAQLRQKHKLLGAGIEAAIYQHRTKGDTVIKVIDNIRDNDPYIDFIKVVLKHQDNPFFPRIYSAKKYHRDEDDNIAIILQLEKLYPLNHPKIVHGTPHILKQLGIKITPDDLEDEGIGNWLPARYVDKIGTMFSTPSNREELVYNSKNPKFIEAMNILEPYFRKWGADLHGNNLLFRITSIGPQPVIIDPLLPDLHKFFKKEV